MRKFLSWYKRKPKTALPRVGLSLRWSFADSVHCRSTSGAERGRKSRIGQCKARGEVQAPRRPAKPTGSSRATGPGFVFLLQSEAGCALPRKVCPWARLFCAAEAPPPRHSRRPGQCSSVRSRRPNEVMKVKLRVLLPWLSEDLSVWLPEMRQT